jgi:A/G-specific adenine glycosylase
VSPLVIADIAKVAAGGSRRHSRGTSKKPDNLCDNEPIMGAATQPSNGSGKEPHKNGSGKEPYKNDPERLRIALLAWYRAHKRDLDWRRTRDPYAIWISEIMLQQTRVAAVTPYYRSFLARFPSARHLATARLDSVLRYWAGLGYYRRARHLHRAAKEIVSRHGGEFPQGHAEALALPGIGNYTAAAVLSIAYNAPLAVVDGNVARVLARLGAVPGELRTPAVWRRLTAMAAALLSPEASGEWNQAMMELGATICTPQSPHCAVCPVSDWCKARALGIANSLPAARKKPAKVRILLAAAVLLDPQGRTLLVRPPDGDKRSGDNLHYAQPRPSQHRSPLVAQSFLAVHAPPSTPRNLTVRVKRHAAPEHGVLFSRLWQFPAIARRVTPVGRNRASHRSANRTINNATRRLARHLEHTLGISAPLLEPLATAKHAVTFRDIRLAPFLVRVPRLPAVPGARTLPIAEIDRLPVSSATRKIAASVARVLPAHYAG